MSATRRGGAGPHDARAGARATPHRAASPFAEAIGPAGDAFEQEADRVAAAIVQGGPMPAAAAWSAASAATGAIQRTCADCQREEEEQIRRAPKAEAPSPAAARSPAPTPGPGVSAVPAQAAPAWLVEDEGEASRGQMRKTAFLALLRREICASVDDAMSGSGRDSAGCPWIDHWIGYYEGRSASQVERALRKYAPEAGDAASARDYVPFVAARVRESADRYAATGEISGVPDDMPGGALGAGVLGVFGGMFFKARPGGARPSAERPESVRASLGVGRPLEGDVRSRMESALGASFSRVRVHTDATAARLSDRLNAHAFAVGAHVAFGAGTYRPGLPVGDALIAHELAHVVQQGGAERAEARADPRRRVPASAALETDADRAAAGAVTGLWGGGRTRPAVVPQVRSGLTLSRCSKGKPPETAKSAKGATTAPGTKSVECKDVSDTEWRASVKAATTEEAQLALFQGRLCNHTVRLAGTSCTTREVPEDYDAAPTFNYDPKLNAKFNYKSTRTCDGSRRTDRSGKELPESSAPRSLAGNAAHWFTATVEDAATKKKERRKYMVLGPELLKKGPLEVQRFAEHEMYHVEHHSEGTGQLTEVQEVETYVQDFKKFFPKMGSLKPGPVLPDGSRPEVYFGADWSNLETYYNKVEAKDRKPYLDELVKYYKDAPANTQLLMREWMKRHEDFDVVKDLRTELRLPA